MVGCMHINLIICSMLLQTALYYIGGLLKHANSLMAFCAPTTNSYKRLVSGYEAPVNLVYSARNSSPLRLELQFIQKNQNQNILNFAHQIRLVIHI